MLDCDIELMNWLVFVLDIAQIYTFYIEVIACTKMSRKTSTKSAQINFVLCKNSFCCHVIDNGNISVL